MSNLSAPLLPATKRLLAACRTRSLADLRDRALLLLGYAGALRWAELVAIEREHVSFTPEGLPLQIPRSGTVRNFVWDRDDQVAVKRSSKRMAN